MCLMTTSDRPPDGPVFDPKGRFVVWRQLANELAKRIQTGTYPPNGRLPSEVDLVAEFGCARDTVRQAISALRDAGWVVTVAGKGSFAASEQEQERARRVPLELTAWPSGQRAD